MLRTSKVYYKSSELYPILHEHFGKSMNLARIKALSMMVCALCKVQRVTYTKLATAFDSEAASGGVFIPMPHHNRRVGFLGLHESIGFGDSGVGACHRKGRLHLL